jgi:hypothetical protein
MYILACNSEGSKDMINIAIIEHLPLPSDELPE